MRNLSSATQHTHHFNGGTAVPHAAMDLVPKGERIRYTTRLPKATVIPVTTPDYDQHIWEVAGQGTPIGMPVNIARAAQRRRERIEHAIAFVLIFAGILAIVAAMTWFTGVLVRVFWGG